MKQNLKNKKIIYSGDLKEYNRAFRRRGYLLDAFQKDGYTPAMLDRIELREQNRRARQREEDRLVELVELLDEFQE